MINHWDDYILKSSIASSLHPSWQATLRPWAVPFSFPCFKSSSPVCPWPWSESVNIKPFPGPQLVPWPTSSPDHSAAPADQHPDLSHHQLAIIPNTQTVHKLLTCFLSGLTTSVCFFTLQQSTSCSLSETCNACWGTKGVTAVTIVWLGW